jgi:hypothetical protein
LAKLPCDDQHFGYNKKLQKNKNKREKKAIFFWGPRRRTHCLNKATSEKTICQNFDIRKIYFLNKKQKQKT